MSNKKVSFSQFGKSFQEELAFLILDDREFSDRMLEVLNVEYLEFKYLQVFIEKIFSYKKKYTAHPSYETLKIILKSDISDHNDVLQKQIRDYYARSLSNMDILANAEYVKDKALDFCRKQKLREAMIKSTSLLKNSSFDEISQVINDALKAGAESNQGYDFLADFEKRYEVINRDTITTGWDKIDDIINGGAGRKELGVVIAPTGCGKSMVLVHLGAQALKAGMNVVHYTFELAETVIAKRYDSCLTGFPLNTLADHKDAIWKQIKDVEGKLIVKEYPTKTASTNTLRAHLTKLIQSGTKPDMIIVDYADLMRTTTQRKAFNKCFVADFIFSVSRTTEDKQTNGGRIYIAKNRNGPDGLVYSIFMDTSNVDIKVIDQYSRGENMTPALSNEERQNLMFNKYKKFLGKGATP
jgi:replicative DNA helicase